MTQVIKDIVTWLKQWFYTEAEIDNLLASKANDNHSHGWELISQSTNYPTKYSFYVNSEISLAELIIQHKDPDAYSGSTSIGLNIGSNYTPYGISVRMSNKDGIRVGVATNGDVYVYGSVSANTNVQASIMWHYEEANIVTPADNFSITLNADKEILSYYDSDTCVLSATVLNNNNPASNQTVEFFKNNVSIGTATTDNNGVATKTYAATGVGDVTFKASIGDVMSEVTVEDCWYYNSNELEYTSSGTSVETAIISNLFDINNQDFILEFDIKNGNSNGGGLNIGATAQYSPPSSANYRIFIGTDTGKFSLNNRTNSSSNTTVGSFTTNTYYHMKLTKSGTSFTGYYGDNDATIATKNATWISSYNSWCLYWINWKNTNYVKNIKLKPL